jgi:hypothetical protein
MKTHKPILLITGPVEMSDEVKGWPDFSVLLDMHNVALY